MAAGESERTTDHRGDHPGLSALATLRGAIALAASFNFDDAVTFAEIDVFEVVRTVLNAAAQDLDWEQGFLATLEGATPV